MYTWTTSMCRSHSIGVQSLHEKYCESYQNCLQVCGRGGGSLHGDEDHKSVFWIVPCITLHSGPRQGWGIFFSPSLSQLQKSLHAQHSVLHPGIITSPGSTLVRQKESISAYTMASDEAWPRDSPKDETEKIGELHLILRLEVPNP